MVKATFTLDDETIQQLRRTAERLGLPQSRVVREAVMEFAARADRLSDTEQLHLLGVLEGLERKPATRPTAAVDRELREIATTRRGGGRQSA
ncbi:MAG: ribbon-helix-helix protein, CopG family [Vicinamibacterales bacterium]